MSFLLTILERVYYLEKCSIANFMGFIVEMAGYIARAPSSKYTDHKTLYIVQLVMIM